MAAIPDSMTVLIHGTFSKEGRWHRPGSVFHQYLRRNGFRDVYSGSDYFEWSGDNTAAARQKAAEDLIDWCAAHPARRIRLLGHSHGANVANLATQMGLRISSLVLLSPPALAHYLPNLDAIACGKFCTVHPTIDVIVRRIARAHQNYQSFPQVQPFETVIHSGPAGHWSSVRAPRWRQYRIAPAVLAVCGKSTKRRK